MAVVLQAENTMSLSKILCPIDFSSASRHALEVAISVAKQTSAELVVAHAWYLPSSYVGELGFPRMATDQLIADGKQLLDGELAAIKAQGFDRVSSLLLTGAPGAVIVDAANADPSIDLIVLGTSGRTGFARILLGSVAEQTVRHAPCSVLAIHATDPVPTFRHILCPVDFSDFAQDAVDLAVRLAQPGGEGLSLLHVMEPPLGYSAEPDVPEFASDLDRHASARLDAQVTAIRKQTAVRVNTHVRIGSPAKQTLVLIDEKEPPYDVVIIGSHGRTGIKRLVLGSVAEKILRHATCPVLVARRRTNA